MCNLNATGLSLISSPPSPEEDIRIPQNGGGPAFTCIALVSSFAHVMTAKPNKTRSSGY